MSQQNQMAPPKMKLVDTSSTMELDPDLTDHAVGTDGTHIVAASKSSVGSKSSVDSRRSATSTASSATSTTANIKNLAILVPPATFTVLHLHEAIDYVPGESACVYGRYSFNVDLFCVVAAIMSAAMLSICAFSWWKAWRPGQSQNECPGDEGQEIGCNVYCHGAICITFWNIVWATIGLWMYSEEFSEECRAEPIAIVILCWSILEFVWLCLSIAMIGALVYLIKTEAGQHIVDAAAGATDVDIV